MQRKDDHIRLAYEQTPGANDFDRVRFVHHAFPELNRSEIHLSTTLFNRTFPLPFFINAMTGGSEQAKLMNERFAHLANTFGIPMATGSVSAALNDPSLLSTFKVVRQINPKGFLIANIGAGQSVHRAKEAIKLMQADALQIHVNAVQEAIMPEGDQSFRGWLSLIRDIRQAISVPLIVKEVGFGISRQTFQQLVDHGVRYVDVAGRGGTNFAMIENQRRTQPMAYLNDWGLSTVESLLEGKAFPQLQLIASGGIRHALDVVKSLALGATMVGMSGYFLHLVKKYPHEDAVKQVQSLIEEIKTIMLILGKPTIASLTTAELTHPYGHQ